MTHAAVSTLMCIRRCVPLLQLVSGTQTACFASLPTGVLPSLSGPQTARWTASPPSTLLAPLLGNLPLASTASLAALHRSLVMMMGYEPRGHWIGSSFSLLRRHPTPPCKQRQHMQMLQGTQPQVAAGAGAALGSSW
ncbi:hypothetical protein HaLaN_10694 [Haematococcus lacustris]|uniref:Secreted protein n=1 Tax=Haematococcus lacustris TaxID=44745 RepID=A0A699YZF2_HAELA|nr:hypothetical protein HaLaN_10694 [Haematococcus lacustris]